MDIESRPKRITCQLNYIRTVPGILKIIQLVCAAICIILGLVAPSLDFTGHKGFFVFVAVLAMIGTLILLALSLINLQTVCIPDRWPMIEMFWCAFIALLFMIAGIVVATAAKTNGVYGAAAFFGFAAMIVYLADAINRFRWVRAGPRARSTAATTTNTTTTIETRIEPTY